MQPYVDLLAKLGLSPTDVSFPDDGNDSWTELALRFTLSQPGVHTAIIGTTNPDNARKNIALVNKGTPPTDVLEKVRQAFRKADADGSWVGLQ